MKNTSKCRLSVYTSNIKRHSHTPVLAFTSPPTARYLGAYIAALTCVLHGLFLEIVGSDNSNAVSEDLISRMVAQYKESQSLRHQSLIRDMGVIQGFEKKIAKLIMEETNTSEVDSASVSQNSAGGPSKPSEQDPGRKRPHSWNLKRLFRKSSPPTWHPYTFQRKVGVAVFNAFEASDSELANWVEMRSALCSEAVYRRPGGPRT